MPDIKGSLAREYPVRGVLIGILLLAALALFFTGIFAPLITFKKLVIFQNSVSMVSALLVLVKEGHVLLFAIIFGFSICLPLTKVFLLSWIWFARAADRRTRDKHLRWMAQYGKWSMLDVFVVALLLVTVKLGVIASVEIHYGVYAFAASIFLMMLVTSVVANAVSAGRRD